MSRLKAILFISALYFIIWSLLVMIFPSLLASLVIEKSGTPLIFWEFMGIVTLILGLVLMIASFNPFKHWLIILLVTLFHISMIAGFIFGFYNGYFSGRFINFLFFNHIIWIIPNLFVLYFIYRRDLVTDALLIESADADALPLSFFDTNKGKNVGEVTEGKQVLLVFLRNFGCPFCEESLMKLAATRKDLEEKGINILLVHMVNENIAAPYLEKYKLDDLLQVSDPEELFYKKFKLKKGSFLQLFGLRVWIRWVELAVKYKLFNSNPQGNFSQMPGVFLLSNGEIEKQFIPESISQNADYRQFL